jgi:hypothetical protein
MLVEYAPVLLKSDGGLLPELVNARAEQFQVFNEGIARDH